jgi:hypothetical protein
MKALGWHGPAGEGKKMANETLREAVGVFHDERSLRSAVDELMISGFDRSALSLLAGHKAIERKLGQMYRKVADIEDSTEIPYRAYAGADSRTEAESAVVSGLAYVGAVSAAGFVVASGGAVALALLAAAAAGGAGGLIGGLLARVLEHHHASYLREQLDRGGLLLWVRTYGPEEEKRATEILRRWSAEDVHVHELPKATMPREGGMSHAMSFMNALGL